MKVKLLKQLLAKYPDDLEIMIERSDSEFRYNTLETVEVKDVSLREEPDGEELANEKYLILSDDI